MTAKIEITENQITVEQENVINFLRDMLKIAQCQDNYFTNNFINYSEERSSAIINLLFISAGLSKVSTNKSKTIALKQSIKLLKQQKASINTNSGTLEIYMSSLLTTIITILLRILADIIAPTINTLD